MTTEAQEFPVSKKLKKPKLPPFDYSMVAYDEDKAEAYAKYWNEYDWGNRKKTHDS